MASIPFRAWILFGGIGLVLTTCAGSEPCTDFAVILGAPFQVVPGAGLPAEVVLRQANNNLDVVRHEGRVYLAFRTAPTHFASPDTAIYVVSSIDQQTWDFEARFTKATDLREPRLLSFDDRLFLYFAVLGSDPTKFEPQGMMLSEYQGPGSWSTPEWFYLEGFIPWRARVEDGIPYLVAYVGGEGIYEPGGKPLEVHWLATKDGRAFTPVIPGKPAVLVGGTSETDFAFLDDGSLIAVGRNEAGDARGFGSRICRATAEDLGNWSCLADPKKYDSPLLFRQGGAVYLVARRNVTETGDYDLGLDELPLSEQWVRYEADYSSRPKRCALWKVDPETRRIEFVLDLPSRGDTCFPALLREGQGTVEIYNYSSALDGGDVSWFEGQLNPTMILRTTLTLDCAE